MQSESGGRNSEFGGAFVRHGITYNGASHVPVCGTSRMPSPTVEAKATGRMSVPLPVTDEGARVMSEA